jgi:hypothetical protein
VKSNTWYWQWACLENCEEWDGIFSSLNPTIPSKNQNPYYSPERSLYNIPKTQNMPIIEGFYDDSILSVNHNRGEHRCPEACDTGCGVPGAFQGARGKCKRDNGKWSFGTLKNSNEVAKKLGKA